MNKIYDIPTGVGEKLKDAFYDVESYKTIMEELVKTDNENVFEYSIYNDFRKHYKEALIRYDTEKINFELDYVRLLHPNATNWLVTFGDNKVEITFPD